MKKTGKCTKCASPDILKIPGRARRILSAGLAARAALRRFAACLQGNGTSNANTSGNRRDANTAQEFAWEFR